MTKTSFVDGHAVIRVVHGECRDVMATLPECSVDAIVTDPPYEIGFMGRGWDKTGVANDAATWRAALRVLKPGGYMLAFSGTRTYHRMVCAIEDAGFEIHNQIGWMYGSGFPKSKNLDGDRKGWGTALKPAFEPICMARKPLIGTVAANVLAHGTGALNIDGCRVETADDLNGGAYAHERQESTSEWASSGSLHKTTGRQFVQPAGRWPANLIHDGSDEVLASFPLAKGQQGALTGAEPSSKTANVFGEFAGRVPAAPRGDTGSAARFFYCAKASKSDRGDGNNHPTVKPIDLMRYLCRLVTPPGGVVLDPFAGSGSTLKAAELEGFGAIGIELDREYVEIARRRIASDAPLFVKVSE